MTSFPNSGYQSTQKITPLNILLQGKKKKSVLEKPNETLGLRSKIPATCLALQDLMLLCRADISKKVLNGFANIWISPNSVNNF